MIEPAIEVLDGPDHEHAVTLLAYWDGKRGSNDIADRAHIDPHELRPLLPHLVIADAVNDGEDFRIRLYGTGLVRLMGEERTGMLMSELGDAEETDLRHRIRQAWLGLNQVVFRERRPVCVRSAMLAEDRRHTTIEGISVPLSNGGPDVAQILGGIFVVPQVTS